MVLLVIVTTIKEETESDSESDLVYEKSRDYKTRMKLNQS